MTRLGDGKKTKFLNTNQKACDFIFSHVKGELRLASPLGLGKPNLLLNQIYLRAKKEPERTLRIFTALSLNPPPQENDFEKKFLGPFVQRHFGPHYPDLEYVKDLRSKQFPGNVHVHEFYMQAGQYPASSPAQRDYVSLNYTHVSQSLLQKDLQVIVQLISRGPQGQYSLSCNPDLTVDLVDLYRENKKDLLIVGVLHPDLPFLGGDAEVDKDFFDIIVDDPNENYSLFALPRMPVETADFWIGLHGASLIRDEGTLQIGIGSLSEALVHGILLRHQNSSVFRTLLNAFPSTENPEVMPFQKGLYGTSEMLMDGFMHLRKAGILKREIFDLDEKKKRFLHASFFLGSKELYRWLKNLSPEDFSGLGMTRVSKVNDLYDHHEYSLRKQRKLARFFNTCMNVSLLGGASSETLEDGRVISGVGGQYNFVAMSHELPDSFSILMLRSVREKEGKRFSNIVWEQGNLTIPRHLRDVVITEYGIAFLKGATDAECIERLLCITDIEFQQGLLEVAKKNHKINADFQLPAWTKNNHPDYLRAQMAQHKNFFPDFPFGSDFTKTEERLLRALEKLKKAGKLSLLKILARGFKVKSSKYREELERMELFHTKGLTSFLQQRALLGALAQETHFT